jgi:hypothetical protein
LSFLSKLGQVLAKAAGIATGIAPVLTVMSPFGPAIGELQAIATVIANTEAIRQAIGLPGTQALKAATPLVAQEILKSALVAGKKIENETLFMQGSQKIADGMVDILDSIHEDAATMVHPQDHKPA